MYNLFFYANACHVCKTYGKEIQLKRCSGCRMISYCNKDHQRHDWPQHKDLCKAINKVLNNNRASYVFDYFNIPNIESWVQIKMNLMLLVGIELGHPLQPNEEQMFKFIRSCTVCHSMNSLVDCPNCPNTSFCEQHKDADKHKNLCSLFKLCFDLDIAFIMSSRKVPKVTVVLNINRIFLPNNMETFINTYWKKSEALLKLWQHNVSYISEYLTRPLTLLFAQEKLKEVEKSDIIIHVIGANMMEVDGFEIWEIILHWLPNLKSLKLIFVGPELSWVTLIPNLCNYCLSKNKNFIIDMCAALYTEYESSKQFIKPDIIIGFNAGIHECINVNSTEDSWAASIRIIAKQNCPFILTSYTFHEAQKEQERLKTILGSNLIYTCCFKNPYSSLRPHRDYETEEVYYQNGYILIYPHLNIRYKQRTSNISVPHLN